MSLRSATLFSFFALLCAMHTDAQMRLRKKFLITPAWIARSVSSALKQDSIETSQPSVVLLSDVFAAEPTPRLDVDFASAARSYDCPSTHNEQVPVRVTCHLAGECLPFFVLINRAYLSAQSASQTLHRAAAGRPTTLMMRSGEHATLMFERAGTRAQITVITLQSGGEGQSVRAVSLDRKHTYTASVAAPNILKGSF